MTFSIRKTVETFLRIQTACSGYLKVSLIDVVCARKNIMAMGQVYQKILSKEKKWSPQGKKSGSETLLKMRKYCHFSMTFSIRMAVENFPRVQTVCSGHLKVSLIDVVYARKKIMVIGQIYQKI